MFTPFFLDYKLNKGLFQTTIIAKYSVGSLKAFNSDVFQLLLEIFMSAKRSSERKVLHTTFRANALYVRKNIEIAT